MTIHKGAASGGQAVDEAEATKRALKAQLFHDPRQEPGKPCACGGSGGLHGEECDCEDGAVLVHTMRVASGRNLTEWEDTFRCSYGCNEYTQTVTLPDTPWGVQETVNGHVQLRVFSRVFHGQEEGGVVNAWAC
ncbi:hypothetical protein ACIQGT_26395 [Streptomyces sp. NPDC093108]|uniref:hypothetical protein n=1 Tax=Streptomyces sp. NPDC093108 TaxID=3366030 RepID=UPI00382C2BBF